MTQTIEGASRAQIAHFLPDAIAAALRSYQTFSEREIISDLRTITPPARWPSPMLSCC